MYMKTQSLSDESGLSKPSQHRIKSLKMKKLRNCSSRTEIKRGEFKREGIIQNRLKINEL
jgi:hypothetical protein